MFHVDIFIGSVSGIGCQEGEYLEDIEERLELILDIMDDLSRPQGRYPEGFVLIYLL